MNPWQGGDPDNYDPAQRHDDPSRPSTRWLPLPLPLLTSHPDFQPQGSYPRSFNVGIPTDGNISGNDFAPLAVPMPAPGYHYSEVAPGPSMPNATDIQSQYKPHPDSAAVFPASGYNNPVYLPQAAVYAQQPSSATVFNAPGYINNPHAFVNQPGAPLYSQAGTANNNPYTSAGMVVAPAYANLQGASRAPVAGVPNRSRPALLNSRANELLHAVQLARTPNDVEDIVESVIWDQYNGVRVPLMELAETSDRETALKGLVRATLHLAPGALQRLFRCLIHGWIMEQRNGLLQHFFTTLDYVHCSIFIDELAIPRFWEMVTSRFEHARMSMMMCLDNTGYYTDQGTALHVTFVYHSVEIARNIYGFLLLWAVFERGRNDQLKERIRQRVMANLVELSMDQYGNNVTYLPQVSEENGQESTSWIMVSSEEDGCLAFEKTPFEKKPGQPGARKRKSGSKLGSKEFRQFWKLAEQSPMDPFTGTEVVYHHRNDWAKKGFPDVCSAMSTGHSTTPRGAVPAENGTATSNGSSISVKSSKRAANTLGSGDDNPNDEEGRKCLEGSHSRPRVQRVKIGRREQLDNLNPVDVILVLDESSPVEEWSQILRAGQARNFQFVKNRRYYEAVYHCICRNSEAQEAAPAVQQHGPELPSQPLDDDSEALENEQDAEEDQEGTHFFLEHGQQQLSPAEADLADLLPEEGMEPVDDDGEAMEKEKDADYSPSSSSGLKEDNDEWLQFPYFFEENIVENLDIPAINVDEEEEVPEDDTSDEEGPNTDPDDDDEHFLSDEEGSDRDSSPSDDEDESDDWIQFPFFFFEEEEMEQHHDADYSPSSSSGSEEDNDEWLQFPYFFEENIVENLDIPAINVDEEEEVPEDDTSDEEGPNTDHDDDDEHFLSDEEGSDRDSSPSDDEDESGDWIQFPFFFFEEEEMEQHHDADYSPSSSSGSEEDNDEWLQFPYFFEENIVENLDIPAINVDEEEEVPEDDTSDEEGPNTDHDDDDEHFLSDEEGSDRDFSPSDAEDEGDDWLQFPFFFEEENNLDLPASDREEEMPMPAVEQPNHEFDGQEEHDEQWMLFPEQSSESEEESMTLEETSDEEDEHNSDPDYALTEEEDPSADEAEWWSNTDFMDDLYSESESDIDDMGKDPDYYPSSGSGDGE